MKRNLLALVLATPRPGPPLLGKSTLRLAVETASGCKPRKIFVCGEESETSSGEASLPGVESLPATKSRGLCGSLLAVRGVLERNRARDVLVIDSRLPLLTPRTLRSLLGRHQKENNALTLLRPCREGAVFAMKQKDFLEVLASAEAAAGKFASPSDLVRRMTRQGKKTGSYRLRRPEECLVVDSPTKVSAALSFLRERKLAALEAKGVILLDPLSTWIDLDVRIGRGTVISPSVVIEAGSRIGRQCRIYPFVHLVGTRTGDRVKIFALTMIERSRVGADAQVGPYTHFRPHTVIRPRAKVGNFVEMKNTVFGAGSKAGHLSYLGDADVGEGVNIGAGTITCNYDGFKKSRTVIERGAFIGSGTQLVAPVRVGRKAYVGAGSVITKNVSPGALAIARGRQIEKPGWVRRRKKR
jgi:bifunctional UDP-N-acetylglucosamine pyrophosphorylase/glucosamine-1-phosphate N-acetyltransferase